MKKILKYFFIVFFSFIFFVNSFSSANAQKNNDGVPFDYIETYEIGNQICQSRKYRPSVDVGMTVIGLGCTDKPQETSSISKVETPDVSKVETPKIEEISAVEKVDVKPVETKQNPSTSTNSPTNPVTNPSVVINPTINGNNNSVSSTVKNTNATSNTVVNNVSNVVNTVSNNMSEYKTIAVNGGILVIGENGFGKFFPTTQENNSKSVASIGSEISYLEKSELPVSIQRSLNRIPEEVSQKKKLRLPISLKDAESITEDICIVENRRMSFISKGMCVLEIPVGEGIYEHEINVIK